MINVSDCAVTLVPSIKSRALNYGDGCFSTMLSRKGDVQLLDLHVKRLINDAKKLKIINNKVVFSSSDVKTLIKTFAMDSYITARQTADKTDIQTEWQIVKLIIARGDSERGYAPSIDSVPVFIPSAKDYYQATDQTLRVGLAEMKLADQSLLSGIKHLNRLEQVMAKIELADHTGLDDLVLTNARGVIIELTSSNIFYCVDGIWHTPCVEKAGVNGVMRQYVLDYMQRNQIACNVSEMNVLELVTAQTAFSCNAVSQLVPISQFSIGAESTLYDILPSECLAQKISDEIAKDEA